MAAPKRTKKQREYDLQEISRLYLQGWHQVAIVDYIAKNRSYTITQAIVSRDLKTIQERWQSSSVRNFDEAKARELAKIDHLEMTAWAAYQKSADPIIKRKTVKKAKGDNSGDDRVIEVSQEASLGYGDPRFLDMVYRCIDRRIKLLGLEIDAGDNDTKPFIIKVVKGVSMDDL